MDTVPTIPKMSFLERSTILVRNRWNRHRFSWIFGKNPEVYSSHTFSYWSVPSPSPMLSHAYFGPLRWLQIPNQHWGGGNRTSVSRFVTSIVACTTCSHTVHVASLQTSCGVCFCSSRIHFSPRTSAKHSRHLRLPITDRLQIFVKRNPSRFFRFAWSVRLLIRCARSL